MGNFLGLMQRHARGSLYLPCVLLGIERSYVTHRVYGLAVGVCFLLCATHEVSLYLSLCDNFVQLGSGIGYAIFPTCWNPSCGANDFWCVCFKQCDFLPYQAGVRPLHPCCGALM